MKYVEVTYRYRFHIWYQFDWGDGTDSGWIGPYQSGEIVNISHSWNIRGNYEIKTKVKDIHELESDWSDPLVVSMPHSINQFQNLIYRLINRLPRLEPILSKYL